MSLEEQNVLSSGLPDVVVRTPASPRRAGAFVSVVVLGHDDPAKEAADVAELEAALTTAFPVHEVVLVLAAGRDRHTWARELALREPNLQILGLLHGASDEIAYTAGLDTALGDVVVTARLGIDPPADIVRCAALVRDNSCVVYGMDRTAGSHSLRRRGAGLARGLASRSLRTEVRSVSLELRGFHRAALDSCLPRRDRDRGLRLLPSLSGYPSLVMPYDSRPSRGMRGSVRSREVLRSMFHASARPLRAAVAIALVASALNVVYALYVVLVGAFRGAVEGWTSTSLQMSLMFFLLSVVIAIMAEFMYQSNETANERPVYRVAFEATSPVLGAREALNVEAAADAVQVPVDTPPLITP